MIFLMTDSQGRQGGSSAVEAVGASGDGTCLTGPVLSSTTASVLISTASTATTSVANSASASISAPAPTKAAATGMSKGATVGFAIGALITVASLVTLGLFFLRKRRENAMTYRGDGSQPFTGLPSINNIHDADAGATNTSQYSYPNPFAPTSTASLPMAPDASEFKPYLAHPPQGAMNLHPSAHPSNSVSSMASLPVPLDTEFNPYLLHPLPPAHIPQPQTPPNHYLDSSSYTDDEKSASSMTSTVRREATLPGEMSYKPTRFVLHTDLDDDIRENLEGVVDLPPQYTDRREARSDSASQKLQTSA
jgi:hypothetical protein